MNKRMGRRSFLVLLGLSIVAAIAGGIEFFSNKNFFFKLRRSDELLVALNLVFDASFGDRAKNHDVESLFANLNASGAINKDGNIDLARIRTLALTDQITPYNGKFYTQTELDIYTLSYKIWG